MKKLVIFLVVLLVFAFGFAEQNNLTAALRELGLTSDQQEQVEAQIKQTQQTLDPILEKIKTKRTELKTELTNAETSQEKVTTLIGEIAVLEKERGTLDADNLLKIKSIIGIDNFKKLLEAQEKSKTENKGGTPGQMGGGQPPNGVPGPRPDETGSSMY
jgi:DNA repair exonuclease SbcCD ATPase subunit